MSNYNYRSASDLVKFCKEQLKRTTRYELGGIGRYAGSVRIFDCIGLIKCFIWHNYSQDNSEYYGKTCPDYNCEQMFARAKEKGRINTIPDQAGIIVYQRGHVGVYIGNGEVIEATAAFGGKVVKSYFKGDHTGNKRTTWTHWFKMPELVYKPATKKSKYTLDEMVLRVVNGLYGNGAARKAAIEAEGWQYITVQNAVNEYIADNQGKTGKKYTLPQMVNKVINGDFGNGVARKKAIESTGWDYDTVQAAVNERLNK